MDKQREFDYEHEEKQDNYRILQKASFWYWGLLTFLSALAFYYTEALVASILTILLFGLSISTKMRRLMYVLLSIGLTLLLLKFATIPIAIITGLITATICVVNNKYVKSKQKNKKRMRRAS
ncbi:hypothetical protein [Aquibacillus saliphilus]|uniref:hypothetical protein n=1 Tax=Aquibacillus saliphilus TaxID=1909422 RepID=UPI001CF0069E|nr:hypothetical protein [Aquibacillus saliphilus]